MEDEIIKAAANLANPNVCKTDNWIEGAKYMAERMYSEEDLRKSFHVGRLYQGREADTTFEEWFEQFKKK